MSGGAFFKFFFFRLWEITTIQIIRNFLQTGNHTITIVQTKEEYDSVRVSLQNVINDVNRMSDRGL